MGKSLKSEYKIDIQGLNFKDYEFDFEIDSGFFQEFENSPITKGVGVCHVFLSKSETMIKVDFDIHCQVDLICDRSLRGFEYPMELRNSVIFKFGNEFKELDDELFEIPDNMDRLDLAPFIYEFVVLGLPMKKLHPEYLEENETENWIYTTEDEGENADQQEIDPRWNNLKELKK